MMNHFEKIFHQVSRKSTRSNPLKKVKLDETRLELSSGKRISIKDQSHHPIGNFLLLTLDDVLPVSSGNTLFLRFESLIKNSPFSFALYSLNSSLSSGISTQFQPGFARMVFPCFDEPSYKSTFDLRLHFNHGYMSRLKYSRYLENKKSHCLFREYTKAQRACI